MWLFLIIVLSDGLQVTNEQRDEQFHFLVFTDIVGNRAHGVVMQCYRPILVQSTEYTVVFHNKFDCTYIDELTHTGCCFLCLYRKGRISTTTKLEASFLNFSLPTVSASYPSFRTSLHSKTAYHGETQWTEQKIIVLSFI